MLENDEKEYLEKVGYAGFWLYEGWRDIAAREAIAKNKKAKKRG